MRRLKYATLNKIQLINQFRDEFMKFINMLRRVLIAKKINNQINNNSDIIDLLKNELIKYVDRADVYNKIITKLSAIINLYDISQLELLYHKNKNDFINLLFSNEFLWKYIDNNFIFIDSSNKLIDIFNNDKYKKYFKDQCLFLAATKYVKQQLLDTDNLKNANIVINDKLNDINSIQQHLAQDLIQIFRYNNFFIDDINNTRLKEKQYILLKFNDIELKKFIQYILNNNEIIEIFKQQIINKVDINKIAEEVHINRILTDLSKINIKIGESIDVDGELLHYMTHDISFLPLIYINGNVIFGNQHEVSEYGGRVHHNVLFDRYFKDEKLHTNDQIKQEMDEWRKCNGNNINDVLKYHGVRAVQKDNVILLIDGGNNTKEATDAIYNKTNNKILALSDNALLLVRTAKIFRLKRMYKQ